MDQIVRIVGKIWIHFSVLLKLDLGAAEQKWITDTLASSPASETVS